MYCQAKCVIISILSGTVSHNRNVLSGTVSHNSNILPGTVYYREGDPSTLVVTKFYYPSPGPDAFFWVGERMVNGGCNDDNIGPTSYSLAPGDTGSKIFAP